MEHLISNLVRNYEVGRINRRQLIKGLATLAVIPQAGLASESAFKGVALNHIALRVTDVARSRDFYRDLLGMPVIRDSSSSCFLGLGKNFLALFRGNQPGMDHYCIAVQDFEVRAVTEKLKRRDLNPRQPAGSSRVYFDDPDGLEVQLSSVDHHA